MHFLTLLVMFESLSIFFVHLEHKLWLIWRLLSGNEGGGVIVRFVVEEGFLLGGGGGLFRSGCIGLFGEELGGGSGGGQVVERLILHLAGHDGRAGGVLARERVKEEDAVE